MAQHMNDSSVERIAVLVAGMHRSGTSALTRVLNIVGCDLPKTLMRPQVDNVAGFWESRLIMNLNEEILASAGSSWDDWQPFDRDWYSSSVVDGFRERVQVLLHEEFGGSRLFVLKDPRFCRLMGFWVEAVKAFGARPLVFSPIRNPLDVAASLHGRNRIDSSVGHLMWLRHALDVEADSRGLKRTYLRYEQLLSDTQKLLDTLVSALGVSRLRRWNPELEIKIAEFLSPELQHHKSEDALLMSNPSLSDWTKDSFEIFDRWTRGEVREEDASNLDRIRAAFDEATPALRQVLAAGQEEKEVRRALANEFVSIRRLVADRGNRIEVLSSRLETSRREVAHRERRIEVLPNQLENSRRGEVDPEGTDGESSGLGSDSQAECKSTAFQTLDTDLHEGPGDRSEVLKRVCIATPDILGPVKNGGIGTAFHHLARLLAQSGHDVVIAYVGRNAADAGLMKETRAFYTELGVAFEPIVPRPASGLMAQITAPTWALLEWLRGRERCFDIVHVSDWHGLGYGPLLAKSLGLAFGTTHFVVHAHGPTLWCTEGNLQLLSAEHELGWVFMERRSVELADTVTCGSAYLLEWMRDSGYAMPLRSLIWPNPFPVPDPSPTAAAEREARDGARLEEVVFFGRLEPRKGLIVFIDAIARLVRQSRAPARVTFLGKVPTHIDGPGFIQSSAREWPIELRTITDFGAEEAVSYLSQPGRLAVLPSLQENSSLAVTECLHAGVPFIATATGGTPELVAPEHRAHALVAADHIALGERIAEVAGAPLRAVRPRWGFGRSLEVWSRWHGQTAILDASTQRFAQRAQIAGAETPLVTVCIVHHERPKLVRMAVDSVLAQDYPALEAVLVDDGSESTEALRVIDTLQAEFAERGWRVLRQENRYAGAARNTAAAAARGEWLLFLDDDNVLFPDAISRLVRAARFSGADCVPAASICFFGYGDPRTDTGSHGAPRRYLGATRAWNRFRNVAGDTCALVRNKAFEAVGGFTEEYRVGLDDLSFFNRLIHAGHRIEPMPDPTYFYRIGATVTKSRDRLTDAAQVRALAPYLQGLPGEERAFFSFAIGQADTSAVKSFKSPKAARLLAEQAMCRHYWPLACELWRELRQAFPDETSGYVQGAQALLNAGRLEEAEALASEAAERFPDRPGGHYQWAEVAMRRGEWAKACERWAALRLALPDETSGYVQGAQALLNAGRLEEAEALAGEAVKRFPDHPGGHHQRAELAMRRRNWAAACERWGDLRRVFPDQASGYVRGAEALLHTDRLEETAALASEAVKRFPDHPGSHHHHAEVAMRRGDWADACKRWEALRQSFPDQASGYVQGAQALLGANRLEEAEALAGEAVARFPKRSGGYLHRAEAAMRRLDWAAACAHWEALRQSFPDQAPGYVQGAQALLGANRLEEAEALAGEAVARFPDRPGGYLHRAEAAMRRLDWAAACERWEALRQSFPDQASGYVQGAQALLAAGRLDEAEALAGEAVARFPDRSGGHYRRAEAAMRRRDWAAACAHWEALRQSFPDHASGYVQGAQALLGADRLDEAEALAGEAVARFPDRPGGYLHRAEAAMRRLDWAAACEWWEALRQSFPDQASGYVQGAQALLGANRLEEAEALAGEAVARFPDRPGGYLHRAEAAMRRLDWAAACARWAELHRALPDHVSGYLRGATLVRRRSWLGIDYLDAVILLDPHWAARASRRPERGPILELRRNGKAVTQAFVKDLLHDVVQLAAGPHTPAHGEALYSLHDALNGEVLAALAVPAFLQARRIVGAVENRQGLEIRGWLLDRGDPEHSRRVAIHVDGRLREVISANSRRDDIARWKGTNGQHGFRWRLPEELAGKEGTRIDVFDADTGRPLRGSPVRIEGGRAVATGRHGT